MDLSILYRGPLSSCNYGCPYCPFAKHDETHAELETDRAALRRFADWIALQEKHCFGILFTPWGEALIRSWYQTALVELSQRPNVRRVAIQTNLSCRLDWTVACDKSKLGLWCTYHPGETNREAFLSQCQILLDGGIRFSVGVVGLKEHLDDARALRRELPEHVYVWINAFKRIGAEYYSPGDRGAWTAIDPLFPINNTYHESLGHSCRTGESVFSVDGVGDMRRCHFIDQRIGNIYSKNWEEHLRPRPCSNPVCGCHIGYVHLDRLNLAAVFGNGILERIPN